jgi:uroporphyrinogen-III synthase
MSEVVPARRLEGRTIVVTRPAAQAQAFARLLAEEGATPVVFPAIEIVDAPDAVSLAACVERLDTFDLAIFISPNAVNRAMNLVRARRAWPAGLRVAAIGRGSARELARYGFAEVLVPEHRFESEALLALPALADVAGWRVVIFRGDGGRELLGDTLVRRGASVEYAECYRRAKPDADAGELLRRWVRGGIDAVTVTSSEGLRNLFDMVGNLGRQWLRRTPLFVPHERIAATAAELGAQRVILTRPADDGLLEGLARYFGPSPC